MYDRRNADIISGWRVVRGNITNKVFKKLKFRNNMLATTTHNVAHTHTRAYKKLIEWVVYPPPSSQQYKPLR